MQADLRESPLYQHIEQLCRALRRPGTGQIHDASEIHASADGRWAVFSAHFLDQLEGAPHTRIGRVDLLSGEVEVLTFGPHTDRLAKISPDARHIAFLSDRHCAGDFQLYLLDPVTKAARPTPRVEGWVEYLHWSPDGKRIVLAVAGHGADVSGGQGAITSARSQADTPSWIPSVQDGDESYRWRQAWVFNVEDGSVHRVTVPHLNIWEVVWCGNDRLAAVASFDPGEGSWYSASLYVIELASGQAHESFKPVEQLGWPTASPSGRHLAVVEGLCSDRWIVAGDVRWIEPGTGRQRPIHCGGIDVTYLEWRSEQELLVAGHCGFDTVVGHYNLRQETFTEIWRSDDVTTGGRYVSVSAIHTNGECVLVGESFVRAPEIAVIRNGVYRPVRSFHGDYPKAVQSIQAVERVTWQAADGLDLQGWLLRPRSAAPHSLVMNIHGGPVWHWRPGWLGRARSVVVLALVQRGYAVFLPNPRGSSGRGQAFARKVKGDLNGADTQDFLSGLDALVARGIAHPNRIGVTGVSYGGGMTSWIITQDSRFSAAVPVSPHTNQVTEHLISNIPHFMALFLQDRYDNPTGNYYRRSPILFAHQVKTPTLNICGALDRCTPPEEAVQFHNALLENGVKSVLVTYPEEGHGVQKFPAIIDYTARVVAWFDEHLHRTSTL